MKNNVLLTSVLGSCLSGLYLPTWALPPMVKREYDPLPPEVKTKLEKAKTLGEQERQEKARLKRERKALDK